MADSGLRAVVVTRPRAQAGALVELLTQAGRTALVFPLLEITPLPDDSALRAALARLDDYALVAFVSPNAIEAAFAVQPDWPASLLLAVVGEGSRRALAAHGKTDANARIVSPADPAHSDSEHLLQALDLAALRGQRALIVRGDGGRELLADSLRAAGLQVDTVAAYRRAVPAMSAALGQQLQALLAGEHDWVLTSSEAVRGLAGLAAALGAEDVANLQRQHFIVPHARIAETAQALGLRQVQLCGSGDERILAALQSRP
ncbi:uroporphyrinogen-III synthase [Massilia sp. TS11]|uniref:uroporphyrinogen-III synthase n=1 Tax=Massilia sp. TS11 TaxID=2908003 RepID=UPI001EDBD1C1|nr:uroporphyrinogen-III synthase [Massilia sp. TS11]MCG2584392.1 uroporphyrinogen-III synthase [Massilia sp. TS11]